MALSTFRRILFGSHMAKTRKPKQNRTLSLESLENREVLSWTTIPKTISWPSSTYYNFTSNALNGSASISSNETDVFTFYAPRSGTYTFDVGVNGSKIDPIAGVFRNNGTLISGDDDSGPNLDSRFTAYLVKGEKYALAVTNVTGKPGGNFKWNITGPSLTVSASKTGTYQTKGTAELIGNTLKLTLDVKNSSRWTRYDHYGYVYLLNAQGVPIHSGSWSLSKRTYGRDDPSGPSVAKVSKTWNLSSWNLTDVVKIRISVS